MSGTASRSIALSAEGAPGDADDTLALPPPWISRGRAPVPLLASVVPLVGALALWLVTGSVLSLWLAALGPLIAGATVLDAARGARRDRRRSQADAALARERADKKMHARHADERDRRWKIHPDVAGFVGRDGEIWRSVSGRADTLVIGAGVRASALRVTGGGDDAPTLDLRRRASRLDDAPWVVPPTAGVAVIGDDVVGAAVLRALVLQLCLAVPPGDLQIVGPLRGENAWAEALPQRSATAPVTLSLTGPGETVPAAVDIPLVRVAANTPPPPRCRVVLTVISPLRALVDVDGQVDEIAPEAVGAGQAHQLVEMLCHRAAHALGAHPSAEPVALAPLLEKAPAAIRGTLPAVIGVEAGDPRVIDLVADGPHAVVAGVTGAGKSELLVTWILSLCAQHATTEVNFLLADFKGGTAFDALTDLPHVTGVLTDLDGSGARRAIESLRAEVRWREGELARAGARDVLDARVELPRLIVVVDEFAALLSEHPELHAVFSDVAARGRALGIHLILGTQRPSGVIREGLLANCPLRISLRVSDAVDSRALIGTAEAAELPGGPEGRGLALIRTAADSGPRRVRIALSSATDVRAVAGASVGPHPRRPWLPELPRQVDLGALQAEVVSGTEGRMLVVGLGDEPEHQRQRPVGIRPSDRGLLVVGAGGSGKSTALRTVAAQAGEAVVVIAGDGESAWDAVAALAENRPRPGTLVLIDDLDAIAGRFPADYAREIIDRLEQIMRGAGDAGIMIVASAQRLNGAAGRLAELLPQRLVLAAATRAEYVAAGGDAAHFAPADPPGRGRLDGRAVQVASGPTEAAPAPASARTSGPPWHPHGALTGFVARRCAHSRSVLAAWEQAGVHVVGLDSYASDAEWAADGPVVIVGDADDWQRHWRVLSSFRADHDLVIDVGCAAEIRVLTSDRALPPYCAAGQDRAWLYRAGGRAERIVLPVITRPPEPKP